MAQAVPDEALARHLHQVGAATLEQLERAKQIQVNAARKGKDVPLSRVLILMGVLTPTLLENLEKTLRGQQEGGLGQIAHYKLLQKLGEGGMGAVYLAEDLNAGREVALKILSPELAGDSQFLSRFKREAIATGKLNHVNIVAAYTFDREGEYCYYAMEYCDGESLSKYLERAQVLSEEEALKIVMQVARGLKHAHEHGIIHRDIKPSNIIVTQDGIAKILDLGLSKNLAGSGESFHTKSGIAVGTPHYISPEQVRGERDVDARTDIYSLGATFYHLATGATPFHASTGAAIMLKHLSEQLPNPQDLNPDVSDGVVQIITKMMAKEPGDRYQDCRELLDDLELVIDGQMPSSQALDAVRSSIAVRRAAPPVATGAGSEGDAQPPRRRSGPYAPPGAVEVSTPPRTAARRGATGKHEPVAPAGRYEPAQAAPARPAPRGRGARDEELYEDEAPAPRSRKTLWMLVGAGVAAVLLVVGLIFAFTGDDQPPTGGKAEKATGSRRAGTDDPVAPVTGPRPAPKTTASAGGARLTGAALEDEAQSRFGKLFEGVSEQDASARLARLEAFLRDYGDAIVAARARVMLGQLKAEAERAAMKLPADHEKAWAKAVNLLTLVKLDQDVRRGGWRWEGTALRGEWQGTGGQDSYVEFPYRPPEEYDFRFAFTRVSGTGNVKGILTRSGKCFAFSVSNGGVTGFESLAGKNNDPRVTLPMVPLVNGRVYTAIVQVRRDSIRGWLDGAFIAQWKPEFGEMGSHGAWKLRDERQVGIGHYDCNVVYQRAELIEVSGRGELTR